jgi:hypothetical protein
VREALALVQIQKLVVVLLKITLKKLLKYFVELTWSLLQPVKVVELEQVPHLW